MKTKTSIVTSAAAWLTAFSLQADVREGLVAYWPLNTASGGFPMTTPDVVAGNDMTGPNMDSNTALVPGRFGNAVSFNGFTDYLLFNITSMPDLDTGLPVSRRGSWTVSAWVKGNGIGQNNKYYVAETSSESINPVTGFGTRNVTNNSVVFVRDTGNSTRVNYTASTNATLDDVWRHVAMTYDAASAQFREYVDGKLDYGASYVPNTTGSTPHNQVVIGALARVVVDQYFIGLVDDVALWGRALSQGEVQSVMTNSIAAPIPQFAPALTMQPKGATNLFEGDNVSLTTAAYGSRPLSYQWRKEGVAVSGATLDTLDLSNVTTNDIGAYSLVITNAAGSVTSVVAQIKVQAFGSASLTDGLVAYWPLDSIVGVKTPDLVSAYDMTLGAGSGQPLPPLVSGRWGSAMSFSAASSQFARVIYSAGSTPAYTRSNFTVSLWAKAPVASQGWAYAEASTVNNNPAFAMGMLNDSKLDMYVRTDSGTATMNHVRSVNDTVWDDHWHHIAWVQHDAGGSPRAQVYIDGMLDVAVLSPAYPVSVNNTALGAYARATPNVFFTGLVDEVAIWERPLSSAEIALLANSYITNPPSRLTPLVVSSFKPDFPAVARGDSTVLRWDVPANATQVLIDPLGDVTSRTIAGIGTTNVTLTNATTFILTVKRGADQVQATNAIGVVDGVAANWRLLDNFDFYSPGYLGGSGWWVDVAGGNSVTVAVPTNCNRMAKTVLSTSGAYLPLRDLTVGANQSCTVFFRMAPSGMPSGLVRQYAGITDRLGNFVNQYQSNVGPAVQPTVNDPTQNPGDWLLAAINVPYAPLTFDTNVLQQGAIYSVWIDVTNVVLNDGSPGNEDHFSVHIQKEGDPSRTTIFSDFISDRDLGLSEPLAGGLPTDNLNRVYLCGVGAGSALFDDFYLSKSGYNATVPRAFGYAGTGATLQIRRSGTQLEILWTGGKLQHADFVVGPWSDVTDATSSPYLVAPAGEQKFYRAVCN